MRNGPMHRPTRGAEEREHTRTKRNFRMRAESAQPAADFRRRRRKTVISFSAWRSPRACAIAMPCSYAAIAAAVSPLRRAPVRALPGGRIAGIERDRFAQRGCGAAAHRRAPAAQCRAKSAAARHRAGRRAARAVVRSGPRSWRSRSIIARPKQPPAAALRVRRLATCVIAMDIVRDDADFARRWHEKFRMREGAASCRRSRRSSARASRRRRMRSP